MTGCGMRKRISLYYLGAEHFWEMFLWRVQFSEHVPSMDLKFDKVGRSLNGLRKVQIIKSNQVPTSKIVVCKNRSWLGKNIPMRLLFFPILVGPDCHHSPLYYFILTIFTCVINASQTLSTAMRVVGTMFTWLNSCGNWRWHTNQGLRHTNIKRLNIWLKTNSNQREFAFIF